MSAAATASLYGSDPGLLSPIASRLLEKGLLKWVIALAASLGAILEVIDTVITNVALPDIRGNLGATLSEAGWISTSYACANVVIIPLSAWLGHRFGRRNYFIFSLIGFTLASLLCGMATSLSMLIFARVLQGLAGGGLLAKAQSIVFEAFPVKERPIAQAIFGLGVIVGPAIGPVIGGWLTDNMGWRWIFFINLPLGILAVMMCTTFMPSDRKEDINRSGKVDWTGIGLLAVGLACFQIFLEEGQQDDWFESKFILAMAVASVIGIALFIWRELTTEHPAVDLRVLRYRSMIGGSLYSAVLGMGLYGIMFAVPIFVQDYLHYTALQSGLILAPGAIASAIMMAVYGPIGGKVSPRVMMFMPLSIATLGPLAKKDIAAGAGFYSLTRQLGSSIGIALITTMLARRQAEHRSVLVEKISDFRPQVGERMDVLTGAFAQHSGSTHVAHDQALGLIDRIVSGQALLLSYEDIFTYVALLFIVTLPLLFLLGGKQGKDAADAAASAH
jgi:DHA2 family multidrug resistance protein